MILGEFRDGIPRVVLPVRGVRGVVNVEFVLDTAFDGNLSLPPDILQQIGAEPNGRVINRLANGSEDYTVSATILLDWFGEERAIDAIIYRSNPLLGTELLDGYHIDIEATEGGQVIIEPL